MSKSIAWKNKFLSSGLPLEHEVASLLASKGFVIKGEYPYTRRNFSDDVDCSVDLHANAYFPLGSKTELNGHLHLLAECKYRSDEKVWLFTPDLNPLVDHSPSWPNGLRQFSEFTTFTYDKTIIGELCCTPQVAMKGMELNLSNGQAHDTGIKHGINQLRYAMPSLTLDLLDFFGNHHPDDCAPLFILPILVTNTPLRMLRDDLTVESVRQAESLESISKEVMWVDAYSNFADGFVHHCKVTSEESLCNLMKSKIGNIYPSFHNIHAQRHSDPAHQYGSPITLMQTMFYRPMNQDHQQYWICHASYLSELIDLVLSKITATLATSKQDVFYK